MKPSIQSDPIRSAAGSASTASTTRAPANICALRSQVILEVVDPVSADGQRQQAQHHQDEKNALKSQTPRHPHTTPSFFQLRQVRHKV